MVSFICCIEPTVIELIQHPDYNCTFVVCLLIVGFLIETYLSKYFVSQTVYYACIQNRFMKPGMYIIIDWL